ITFSYLLLIMMLWGAISLTLAPPKKEYIIQTDPETAGIHQSFNNSALQIGIALGSAIGGVAIQKVNSITSVAHIGAIVVIVAFVCALYSFSVRARKVQSEI